MAEKHTELLPCPFCGSAFNMGQEPHDNHPIGGKFYLYHEYGPLGSVARACPLEIKGHFETAEAAAKAWNTRSIRVPVVTDGEMGIWVSGEDIQQILVGYNDAVGWMIRTEPALSNALRGLEVVRAAATGEAP